jgi:spore coat polysaccharide biosynthesis protein SpsF
MGPCRRAKNKGMNMKGYKTEQEKFWAGKFGKEYIHRNKDKKLLASKVAFFSKVLSKTKNIGSVIEFGASIGLNLAAIKALLPGAQLSGLEINREAARAMKKISGAKVYQKSILQFTSDYKRDLVLSMGFLIHVSPDALKKVYKLMYNTSKKYICVAEYYNPSPVQIEYRGHKNKLFKRDFAGEMLDLYKDLSLLDYGFVYRRDNLFPQDDITWFLLEKK